MTVAPGRLTPDKPIEPPIYPNGGLYAKFARASWHLVNQPGGLAVALLVIFLLFYTGKLDSPISRIETNLRNDHGDLIQGQKEVISLLRQILREQAERNLRERLIACAEIKNDPDLRKACLGPLGANTGTP